MARDRESGYALLLVFLMAAMLAIAFYSQIPRVAFQSQRHKERLLMTRGMEYMRGIQTFRQTFPGQPIQRMEDLETFQSRHFIRHKYVDPMTGKSEWRLIHMVNGVLIDSALTKAPDANGDQKPAQNTFIIPGTGVGGGGDTQGQSGPRPQDRIRASERPGGAGTTSDGQLPPIPGPVSDGGPPPAAGTQANAGDQTGQSQTGQTGDQQNQQANGTDSLGRKLFAFSSSQQSTPTAIPGTNPAGNLINQLLTQPRQGPQGAAAGAAGVNGIAGVASAAKVEGIMTYNSRTAYNEWEFVFDPRKMPLLPGAGSAGMGNSPMSPGSPQTTGQAPIMQSPRMGQTQVMQGMVGSGTQSPTGGQGSQSGTAGMQNTGAASGGGLPPNYRPGRP